MMEELVYVNGSLVPASAARISPFDQGFLYGYGLFETMRAYQGRIFQLERHLERLHHGARAIGLEEKLGGLDLAAACRETVSANGYPGARVRITVTGGDKPGFPWEEPTGEPTIVVMARQYRGFSPERYAAGYRAMISTVRRCADSVVSGIKSVNYLITVLARREAVALGLDESLLLNDRGFIAEGGNSNVFFVRGGRLVTPALKSGILPGITRELVMKLAAESGIDYVEEDIRPDSLGSFDEAFFTSSVIEIMPLVEVMMNGDSGLKIGDGKPGEITRRLMMAYTRMVERETTG